MPVEADRVIRCSMDGSHVPPDAVACPACGSRDFVGELFVTDEVRVIGDYVTKLKRRRSEGPIKPHFEYEQRSRRWNHDRQRYEQRTIVVDREDRTYVQEWRDAETGVVTWRKEGSLDDPEMFGQSAHGGDSGE